MFLKRLAMCFLGMFLLSSVIPELSLVDEAHAKGKKSGGKKKSKKKSKKKNKKKKSGGKKKKAGKKDKKKNKGGDSPAPSADDSAPSGDDDDSGGLKGAAKKHLAGSAAKIAMGAGAGVLSGKGLRASMEDSAGDEVGEHVKKAKHAVGAGDDEDGAAKPSEDESEAAPVEDE